jgi:hypothetical protein
VWVNLLIVIFFLHPLILFALYKIALLSNVSILDTSPLRTIIARTCRKRFQIPTFITVTKRDTTTDPDILSLTNRSVMTRPGVEVKQWAISGKRIYVQEYLRIDGLAEKDRIEGLMASSALPLGIFPGIKMKGVWYADGGVVDNIPIYPLISLFPCEELFVIQLEPLPKKANGLEDIYKTNWQIHHQRLEGVKFYKDVMDRCAILTKNSVPKDVARNEIQAIVKQAKEQSNLSNEENLAFQAIDNWPRRIITIAPEKNYGFWNGTLNFNAKFTRRLIRKGRRDAYRILKQDMN